MLMQKAVICLVLHNPEISGFMSGLYNTSENIIIMLIDNNLSILTQSWIFSADPESSFSIKHYKNINYVSSYCHFVIKATSQTAFNYIYKYIHPLSHAHRVA